MIDEQRHSATQPNAVGSKTTPLASTRVPNVSLAAIYATAGISHFIGSHRNVADNRFHAFHALFTTVAFFAAHAVLGVLGGKLVLLQDLLDLGALGFTVYQAYRAYQGSPIDIPVIGAIAHKQTLPSTIDSSGTTLQ